MFKKWQNKWKVTGLQLALIIATFALGGSLCGYVGRFILQNTQLEKGALWIFTYILLVTLLWPLCVLIISVPLGQFGFFKKYVGKILSRFNIRSSGQKSEQPIKDAAIQMAIFASGAGSNAKKIIQHFVGSPRVKIALIVCNKPEAGVLNIARENNIPILIIEKDRFFKGDSYLNELHQYAINYIVLAGFLWKLPGQLIKAFQKRIINIHPALLPAYGGKGMYGHFVHEAVIANKEKQSGITIHYVDELYDHGETIFQATCEVNETDTPNSLAEKIHQLEHLHYPAVIDGLLQK